MHFVGVDLAWGERNPTGLAVLDDSGHLLHVSAVRTDDEIAAALGPYTSDDCLVAIDAPLIVKNATGNRPAEAALNKDFAKFDAGAHPSNTGKPEFAAQPRGARIAARLGLDINPRSGRNRRAIEVYPHPATVALFRLGRTLKYKDKSGRDFAQLQAQLIVLLGYVDGLADADPALHLAASSEWKSLRAAVTAATRKSELRVVEDQVDAVLCAYVALFATRCPDAVTTYGDFETGYVVTPSLPDDLVPTPREPRPGRADTSDPGGAVAAYVKLQPKLRRATDQVVEMVTAILDDVGINYLSVTGRAKSVASFATKAGRRVDGRLVFNDPLTEITDQIGVRVITYVRSDVQAVADLLADQALLLDDRDLGDETASEGRFGYASRHLQIGLKPEDEANPELALLAGRQAQVQIRTVLQHAWAEFEHDIRYKGVIPHEHARDFDRRFTLAAGLLELADQEFSTIRDRLRDAGDHADESADVTIAFTPRELAAYLAGQYADAGWSRTEHYAWVAGLLADLGITSLAELAEVLHSVDGEAITEAMAYRYPPGAVRRLDDALLAAFGETYIALPGNAHRAEGLQARLAKITG